MYYQIMYYHNGKAVEEDDPSWVTPAANCNRGRHEYCDTGLLATYCKHCGAEGVWCRRACKYVSKGEGATTVSDNNDS